MVGACADTADGGSVSYSGEVQFAGYTDSSRSGPRITLRLAERADLESFVGCEGKRYMLALVEIGDDEQPVEKPKGGERAKWCAIRCQEPEFQSWVVRNFRESAKAGMGLNRKAVDLAAYIVRSVCEVESRAELDTDKGAAEVFDELIRRPWMAREKQEA
jgi:hypothetical protein